MPGGGTDPNLEELARRRARRRSVLDFITADLKRARAQFPASFKEDLDVHETAIRELEQGLDAAPPGAECAAPLLDSVEAGGDHLNTLKVAQQHFKVIHAAFACDRTRVVTFMWATGASRLALSPLGTNNLHSTSHENNRSVLSQAERWFSEHTAAFIADLAAGTDIGGGKLIESTLVWYINEVSQGHDHSFNDYPFLLFGGANVGLVNRGRVLDVSGQGKTSNDVWSSLAPQFGGSLTSFETEASGGVPGLFG